MNNTSSSNCNKLKRIFCKECHVSLGVINWKDLQETDDVRCSKCALKGLEI